MTSNVPLKQNIKGRAKFKPASNYHIDDVKKVLSEKIFLENSRSFSDNDSDYLQHVEYDESKINILSLFSGCGGLDLGFELSGLQAVVGKETAFTLFKDKRQYNSNRHKSLFHTIYTNDLFREANETYNLNFPSTHFQHAKDIRLVKNFPRADLVIGGFPCPGFSEAGPRLIDDERNFLYIHFIRAITQAKPAIFIAENVKGMLTLGKGEVIRQITEDFSAAGYKVKYKLLNSRDFGVPQNRERVFIVGVRGDLNFEYHFPEPTHGNTTNKFVSLKDAIGDLVDNPGPFYTGSFSSIYMSRNRKKSWNDQSFTIQASGRQAPLHPSGPPMKKIGQDKWIFQSDSESNRRLSVKEVARIQTFPDWYIFSDGGSSTASMNNKLDKQYKQIGNAVPVLLAKAVADPIADWAKSYLKNRQTEKSQQLILF